MPFQAWFRTYLYATLCAAVLLQLAAPLQAQTAPTSKPATSEPAKTGTGVATEAKEKSGTPAPASASVSPKEIRDAQIAADTQRLYQLAEELKIEVNKSSKDTLSLSVIKKAAEIEKLAHSLKERMRKE